ncbi:ammonium transmembrane transporter activity protein [Homalodisca vitripennis]|nr:ammonium transmembrane transporter activity protein [Homalodisca vitripennis]
MDSGNVSLTDIALKATILNFELLEKEVKYLKSDMDDMFLVFCAIITSFMQVGFASLEAGFVNSKNVTNIILKNVLDSFICAIFYWLIGFSLAYSQGNKFLGYSGWAGTDIPYDKYSFWVFEFVFASTPSTILSGAVAERCSFITYMAYSSIISGVVYPIASHWAWSSQGWLSRDLHYQDMAGCGVVHALGGSCAFVAAVFLGPRIGRFQDGRPVDKPGHSMSMVGVGGLILISGFLGFNAGALGRVSGQGPALGRVIQNTVMGGSGAGVSMLLMSRLGMVGERVWAFATTLNAVIAGMVAVCGAVDQYTPLMSLATGAGGCLVFLVVRNLIMKFQVDDPLDAVAVHFGGGFFGVIAGPLFTPNGLIYGATDESIRQLRNNVLGGAAIVTWSVLCSILLFGSLRLLGLLRVSEEQEIQGLDVSKHKEPAYPVKGWVIDFPVQVQQNNGLRKNGSYTLNRSEDGEFIMIGPHVTKLSADDGPV